MTNHMFPYIILSHSKNKSNDTTTQLLSIFNIETKGTKVALSFQHLKWCALKINPKP